MGRLRTAFLSVTFALLLAVRMASPFGFMPGEANGRFALVECPDAIPIPSSHHGMHHGEEGAKAKPLCPFAAGMAPAGPLPTPATVIPPALVEAPPAIARLAAVGLSTSQRLRPPSRAPPVA